MKVYRYRADIEFELVSFENGEQNAVEEARNFLLQRGLDKFVITAVNESDY